MIVITTPTGSIGRHVLANVLAAGQPVRVIARDPSKLPADVRDRVEVVTGSMDDPAVVDRAFAGAETLFWLPPPNPRAPSAIASYVDFTRPACDVIRARGVRRVVGISALGRGTPMAADAGLVTASLAMDDLIAGTGVAYRALILPSFMDNILRQVPSIRADGAFGTPVAGDLKSPKCAVRDIAAVAARLLLDGTWTGRAEVPVMGPEDLSFEDMARIMADALGKPIHYRRIPNAAFRAGLIGFGASEAMAQATLDMMVAKNAGLDNAEPRTAEATTPTSFRQWCDAVLKPAVLG